MMSVVRVVRLFAAGFRDKPSRLHSGTETYRSVALVRPQFLCRLGQGIKITSSAHLSGGTNAAITLVAICEGY